MSNRGRFYQTYSPDRGLGVLCCLICGEPYRDHQGFDLCDNWIEPTEDEMRDLQAELNGRRWPRKPKAIR